MGEVSSTSNEQFVKALNQYSQSLDSQIRDAKRDKGGVYSKIPEVSLEEQKKEVSHGKKLFGSIFKKEETRVRELAMKENARVMKLLKKMEKDIKCPLCLVDLPAIHKFEESPVIMGCCGVRLCGECHDDWNKRQLENGFLCFSCRRPSSSPASTEELALNNGEYGRAFALSYIGSWYLNGINGKEQDVEKAYSYNLEAAQLGYPNAQGAIALSYLNGTFYGMKTEQSNDKAIEWAKKALDQGCDVAKFVLSNLTLKGCPRAKVILSELIPGGMDPVDLSLVAAYQGHQISMGFVYGILSNKIKYFAQNNPDLHTLAYALYWSGKISETVIENDRLAELTLMEMVTMLDLMSRKLHRRSHWDLETFPGYSVEPLKVWIKRRLMKDHPSVIKAEPMYMCPSIWTRVCAHCGLSQGNANIKLRKCAHCKAFSYCSRECQLKHWKAGHKVDCKGHWLEEFFPNLRNPKPQKISVGVCAHES